MKNIAPQIVRQRLLIEANYKIDVDKAKVAEFLLGIAKDLELRTYGEPIIHSPSGEGKEANQGYDAFVPLIDSGISLYVWTSEKFMSCVVFSCKYFSVERAVEFTRKYFRTEEFVYKEF